MAAPFKVTFTVTDADGETSSPTFYIGSGNDPAIIAPVTVLAADALIQGIISNISYTVPLTVAGLKEVIGGQKDVLVGGRFIAQTSDGFKASITLPTFDNDTYVPAGSENIDRGDTDVAAFITSFLNGSTNQDNDLSLLTKAYEVFGGKK